MKRFARIFDKALNAVLDIEQEPIPAPKAPAPYYTGKFRRTSTGKYLHEVRGGFPDLEFGQ